jgi:hypothetical protein
VPLNSRTQRARQEIEPVTRPHRTVPQISHQSSTSKCPLNAVTRCYPRDQRDSQAIITTSRGITSCSAIEQAVGAYADSDD